MARDDGFAVADIATAKHSDPKFRALWRHLRDEAAMNAAGMLYEAVQLASWQHGERVTAIDAAPVWMTDITAPTAALVHVGLLDASERIPDHAWTAWFAPAVERRATLRERWRRANSRRTKGDTSPSPRGNSGGTATPDRPSGQTDKQTSTQSVSRAPRGATGLAPIGGIVEAFPPFRTRNDA